MIQNLPFNAIDMLLKIYNCSWLSYSKNLLEICTNIKLIAILKPNKDKNNEELYRPISLISYVL